MRVARLIVLVTVITNALAIQWLSLANAGYSWNRTSSCVQARNQKKLHAIQTKLCKDNLELMKATEMAANQILNVCQDVFSLNRWNCASATTAPNFTPDLTTGTREQAYVYALASAGLVHSVARACSAGELTNCGCGSVPREPPEGDFKWGGCSDDLRSGSNFGRQFTDKPWRQKAAKDKILAPVNRHNNRLGRRVVSNSLRTRCKCHGVSGACNIKTCWKALPPLRDVGELLKLKYQRAIEVETRKLGPKTKLRPVNSQISSFNNDDLIYITKSPDYCNEDARAGSLGTRGRTCNASSSDTNGCDSMCCGRGHRTSMQIRENQCHCKYHWCCYVKCKRCEEVVEHHVCQ